MKIWLPRTDNTGKVCSIPAIAVRGFVFFYALQHFPGGRRILACAGRLQTKRGGRNRRFHIDDIATPEN
jgi:hypothetical protein